MPGAVGCAAYVKLWFAEQVDRDVVADCDDCMEGSGEVIADGDSGVDGTGGGLEDAY